MNVLFYLFITNLATFIISQNITYCDLTKRCDSCTICGQDTKNYCSCNFYNSYCINSETLASEFSKDFLLNYDGCLSSNGNNQGICGSSDLSLINGETKIINYKSTSNTNFLCYYSFGGSKVNNNRIVITLSKNEDSEQKFDLYIITYPVNGSASVTMLSDSILNNNPIELEKVNFEKMSIYFDIEDANNLDKISLSFLYKDYSSDNNDSTKKTTIKSSNSSSNNTGIIVGIIIGIVALIIIITTFIILYRRNKKKKSKIINNSNLTSNNLNQNPDLMSLINMNKEKLDAMFRTEFIPRTYNEKNVTNDCYNCTICMEKFIDNSSIIITTKCNHSFHEKCFKNWVYKNIISPKCPNCNYLFLGPADPVFQNVTLSSFNDFTIQSNVNANKTTFTNIN